MSLLDRFRPPGVPEPIANAFGRDEHVLALAPLVAGGTAAVTRFGVYLLADGATEPERIPWHLVSKARLDAGTLSLTVADEVDELPGGAVVLIDRDPIEVRPEGRNKLTDIVHTRVRGSVIASQRLANGGAAGWVALRSVAGRNGFVVQFRPDPDAIGPAAAWDAEVSRAASRLAMASGRVPVDE